MARSLLTGATGGLMATASAPNLEFLTGAIIALLGGGLLAALVAAYKARSERSLNGTEEMGLLFDKQRQVNVDQLEQHEREIAAIQAQLKEANGDRERLQRRLAVCQRERTALRNQLRGLEATLDELKRRSEKNPG